ncbi:hypothetical protein TrRE_jg9807, partial [Triparma retinervis]
MIVPAPCPHPIGFGNTRKLSIIVRAFRPVPR